MLTKEGGAPTPPSATYEMDRTRYFQGRFKRGAQSLAFVLATMAVLFASGWLLFGGLMAVAFAAALALLLTSSQVVPLPRLLAFQGARPLPPYAAPWLSEILARLSRRAELAKPVELYFLPSRTPQAYSIESGNQAAIVVTGALLETLTPGEVEAVVAHELSHLRSGDTRWMRITRVMRLLTRSLASFALILTLAQVVFGEVVVLSAAGLAFLIVAPTLSLLFELGLSRTREFDADLSAAALTGRPLALASALIKIERTVAGFWGFLSPRLEQVVPEPLRSHPSTEERVRRLVELAPPTDQRALARLAEPWPRRGVWFLSG